MIQTSIENFQSNIKLFLTRVKEGNVVQIISDFKVIAELTPVHTKRKEERPFGLAKGEFNIPDDFNKPLSKSELMDFSIE